MDLKMTDFKLQKTSMTVASGEQRVTSVVQRDGFLVYTIESTCSPEVTPTWGVYVVHDASEDQTPTKILASSSRYLACGSSPEFTSISEDGFLAISLRESGVKMYMLTYNGFNAQKKYLFDLTMNQHCYLMAKWIAQAHEGHCMVSHTMETGKEKNNIIWVHSCITGRSSFQDLLECPFGSLVDVDASEPGHVIALLTSGALHVFTRMEKGTFLHRIVELSSMPIAGIPIRSVIGNRMFAVSTASTASHDENDGNKSNVLCFNIQSGEMTNHVECKGVATALATDGSRCAFGVSCEEESALYCVHENHSVTFTLSYELGRLEWPKRAVSLDSDGFACAVTYDDDFGEGCNVSTLEYCAVEFRPERSGS